MAFKWEEVFAVIIKGDQKTAVDITKAALDEGMAPGTVLADGLIAAAVAFLLLWQHAAAVVLADKPLLVTPFVIEDNG